MRAFRERKQQTDLQTGQSVPRLSAANLLKTMVVHAAMFEPVSARHVSSYSEKYSDFLDFERVADIT